MAIVYRLAVLAVLIFTQESRQEDGVVHTTSTTQPNESEANQDHTEEDSEASPLAPFEWASQTGHAFESRRRRPDKGWGAIAPVLLAMSSVLPLLLTGLAALAGKALMSSVLALAVAGFNLFRSTQPNQNGGL